MIISITSQKGGPGKSTIATNVAVELARQGKDVCLVDADPQLTVSRWHGDREANGHEPRIVSVAKVGNVAQTLRDLDAKYDVVLVDTPGKDSMEMRTAMTVADLLLVVVRPSQFDLDTLEHLSDVIEQARVINPDVQVRGLLSQVPTYAFGSEQDDAADYLEAYPLFVPMDSQIHERKAYRDVAAEGLGVTEWNNRKAAAEIIQLAKELMN